MLNSRDISCLRGDVALNCRKMLAIAASDGVKILVTGTVRDREYQEYCLRKGTAKTGVPSFHSVDAGLAFDICKNVSGHEYDDEGFWRYCGALGKRLGFTWGGDWNSFPDKPHFQWDANGKYTSAMVRAGKYPPPMPEYKEEEMTYEDFVILMDRYLKERGDRAPSSWSEEDRKWAEKSGILMGDGSGNMRYKAFCTREELAAMLHRLQNI